MLYVWGSELCSMGVVSDWYLFQDPVALLEGCMRCNCSLHSADMDVSMHLTYIKGMVWSLPGHLVGMDEGFVHVLRCKPGDQ